MRRRLHLLGLLLPLCSGCWAFTSKEETEKVRTDMRALQGRVDALEQRDAEAKQQLAKLNAVLEEATALVTRNSADSGLQVQRLQQDLTALMGKVDELQHSLDTQQKEYQGLKAQAEAGAKGGVVPPPAPADKESIFASAREKLTAGDHDEARRLLRLFLTQYPQDPRAPQAQLMHGDSYFQQKKYAAGIGEFQKVIDQYPKSSAVENAMYKIGLSFLELRYCTEARTFLSETLKRYPQTGHAKEIRATLTTIQKNAKNRKVCNN